MTDRIDLVKARYEGELGKLPNVVGVAKGKKWVNGVQTDEDAILVLVKEKKLKSELTEDEIVPESLEGVNTDVYESDEIHIFQDPRRKWRPILGGVSIGHYRITAGTLGAIVRDSQTEEPLVLSNNHVLANSNDAEIDDPVYQPGPTDGGSSAETAGELLRFVPLELSNSSICPLASGFVRLVNHVLSVFGRETRLKVVECQASANVVDAAVARPTVGVSLAILKIGVPRTDLAAPEVGLEIQKFGRTTEYTKDKIIGVDAMVNVGYGGGKIAVFEHQIIAGPMSAGGDSGSLVLDMEKRPVGLLFAGSDKVTIINEIARVMEALEIKF